MVGWKYQNKTADKSNREEEINLRNWRNKGDLKDTRTRLINAIKTGHSKVTKENSSRMGMHGDITTGCKGSKNYFGAEYEKGKNITRRLNKSMT